MERLKKTLILLFVAGIPAAAPPFLAASPELCFTAGSTTYQLSPRAAAPDYRVRIDNAASHPDLRVRMVDRPETADFVLVDDGGTSAASACRTDGLRKTVRLVSGAADITIGLARDAQGDQADFTLYVHSARVRHEDAAALFALMRHDSERQALAANR